MHIKKYRYTILLLIICLMGSIFSFNTYNKIYAEEEGCEYVYGDKSYTLGEDGNGTVSVTISCKGSETAKQNISIQFNSSDPNAYIYINGTGEEVYKLINPENNKLEQLEKDYEQEKINEKKQEIRDNCTIIEINSNRLTKTLACEEDQSITWTVAVNGEYDEDTVRESLVEQRLNKVDEEQEYKEYNEKIHDRAFLTDFFNTGLNYSLTDGSFLSTEEERQKRLDINTQLLKGNASGQYRLYDRFGIDLRFIPYYGETGIDIKLFDHLYSALTQHKLEQVEIWDVVSFNSNTYLSTIAYEGRAPVLNTELVKLGMVDPRVSRFNNPGQGYKDATDALLGSFFLDLAKLIIKGTDFLATDKVIHITSDIVEFIETSVVWEAIKIGALTVMTLGIIAFLISLGKQGAKYAVGSGSFQQFLTRFFEGFISVGLILAFIAKPTVVNTPLKLITTEIYNIFMATPLKDDAKNDDVRSMENDSVLVSTLFRDAILDPWSYGMFGKEYDEMYTQYSPTGVKWEQSHDESHTALEDGSPTFDSAGMTGDVFVPYSNGGGIEQVKNWAAYAWSTSTIYHIDSSTQLEMGENAIIYNDEIWPSASRSYGNGQIYNDSFRWIDTQLNISPQYGDEGLVMNNYTDSRPYEQHFISGGLKSLKLSALLLIIWPELLIRVKYLGLVLLLAVRFIIASVYSLYKENTLAPSTKNIFNTFKEYLEHTIKVYIMIFLYLRLATDENLIKTAVYLFAIFALYNVKLNTIRYGVMKVGARLTGKAKTNMEFDLKMREVIMYVTDKFYFEYERNVHDSLDLTTQVFDSPYAAANFIVEHFHGAIQNIPSDAEFIAREIYEECRGTKKNTFSNHGLQFQWANYQDKMVSEQTKDEDALALHRSVKSRFEDTE